MRENRPWTSREDSMLREMRGHRLNHISNMFAGVLGVVRTPDAILNRDQVLRRSEKVNLEVTYKCKQKLTEEMKEDIASYWKDGKTVTDILYHAKIQNWEVGRGVIESFVYRKLPKKMHWLVIPSFMDFLEQREVRAKKSYWISPQTHHRFSVYLPDYKTGVCFCREKKGLQKRPTECIREREIAVRLEVDRRKHLRCIWVAYRDGINDEGFQTILGEIQNKPLKLNRRTKETVIDFRVGRVPSVYSLQDNVNTLRAK